MERRTTQDTRHPDTESERSMSTHHPDPYATEAESATLFQPDTRTPAEKHLAAMLEARGAGEQGAETEVMLRAIALELIERDLSHSKPETAPEASTGAGCASQPADRRTLQATGKHPSPCARFCEATAFGIKIRGLESQLAQAQTQHQPLPVEPACPVCSRTPTFEHDRRTGEWAGRCKHCAVEGHAASTETEARRLWVAWHHKRSDTTPPAQREPLFGKLIAQHPGLAEELKGQP